MILIHNPRVENSKRTFKEDKVNIRIHCRSGKFEMEMYGFRNLKVVF